MTKNENRRDDLKRQYSDRPLTVDELRGLMHVAEAAVREVLELAQGAVNTPAEFQGNDIHTSLDEKSHNQYLTALEQTGIPILSEENPGNVDDSPLESSALQWVIDPIDGTYNHWRRLPVYGTSIALFSDGNPWIGVIGNLVTGDVYTGGKGHAAMKNGQPINVSTTTDVNQAVLATGIPVGTSVVDWSAGMTQRGFDRFGKIRMLGSASASLAYLAEGIVDHYWESGIFIWDIAAGLAIASASGASVNLRPLSGVRFDIEVSTRSLELLG